jgi:magnesium-protoporphyrin O-methyltransferase
MPSNCCQVTDSAFSENEAKANLKDYRRRGPATQTKLILDAVRSLKLKNASVLDIGGGVGAIYHELFKDIAREAIHVDASSAYLKAAKAEAVRQGHEDRVQFIHADFTEVAADLPQVDVVTLDRVVCCYPNFRDLLTAAASKGRTAIAMTYPREVWWTRVAVTLANFYQRLVKDPFRGFVHPVDEMDAVLNRAGLKKISTRRLFVWEMALYQREGARA